MPNYNIKRKIILSNPASAGVTYDPESQALFDRMTVQPNDTRKQNIDNFIVGIKADLNVANLSNIFDCIWFTAAHDQQASRLNWVQNAFNLTEVNAPVWELDRGYTDITGAMYLDTNYNPATNGTNYTRDNCSFGTYLRLERIPRIAISIGNLSAGNGSQIYPRYIDNIFYSRVNSSDLASTASTSSAGFFTASRTNATQHSEYKNGTLLNTAASISLPILSLSFYLLALNLDGSAFGNETNNQLSFAYVSNGSSINQASLYNRIQTYLTDLGAQV